MLTVGSAGLVVLDFRTYVTCSATVTTGCDQFSGNEIIDGGHVSGQITQVLNPTTVMVTITASTVPSTLAPGTYKMGRDLARAAVALFAGQFNGVPFCSSASPSGYCGA
jgi:hypothetical protein